MTAVESSRMFERSLTRLLAIAHHNLDRLHYPPAPPRTIDGRAVKP